MKMGSKQYKWLSGNWEEQQGCYGIGKKIWNAKQKRYLSWK